MTTGPGSSGTLPHAISAACAERSLDLLRNVVVRVQVRRQELVRELTRAADFVGIRQSGRDESSTMSAIARTRRDAAACSGSCAAPADPSGAQSPSRRSGPSRRIGQQVPARRAVRPASTPAPRPTPPCGTRSSDCTCCRQVASVAGAHFSTVLVGQPTEQRPARVVPRRRPGHAQHVAQARIVTDRRRQQLARRDASFSQRWNARCSDDDKLLRPNWPERTIWNSVRSTRPLSTTRSKTWWNRSRVALRQHQQQRRRHVLHERPLAA